MTFLGGRLLIILVRFDFDLDLDFRPRFRLHPHLLHTHALPPSHFDTSISRLSITITIRLHRHSEPSSRRLFTPYHKYTSSDLRLIPPPTFSINATLRNAAQYLHKLTVHNAART